ncbi:hypothetical protein ACQV2B_01050 [Pantoea allii]
MTHSIGSWAKAQEYDGILSPSARNPTGSNLVSFVGFFRYAFLRVSLRWR